MALNEALLLEFDQEMANTRKILERVPDDKLDWKPHEKSMAVRQLRGGADARWADVAIECGFYDQAHFANEFRSFSGIDLTTYRAMLDPMRENHTYAK
jgi:AraC-like DNA-binding protein